MRWPLITITAVTLLGSPLAGMAADPSQSTGTGTQQGANADTTTTGPAMGSNAGQGSATGEPRDVTPHKKKSHKKGSKGASTKKPGAGKKGQKEPGAG